MSFNLPTVTALAAIALLPFSATAAQSRVFAGAHDATPCTQWNIAGTWLSAATNNFHVTFRFTQTGTRLRGTATNPPGEAAIAGYATGKLTGTLSGNHFRIVVVWAPRSSDHVQLHGLYTGTVVKNHIVRGLGTDLTTKPTPTPAAWSASGPSRCVKT